MEVTSNHYREMLREELQKRNGRNPRYSLRAFAKCLGVDVAALSRVLSNKQTITMKTANGRITCAESLGHKEFVITKLYRSA